MILCRHGDEIPVRNDAIVGHVGEKKMCATPQHRRTLAHKCPSNGSHWVLRIEATVLIEADLPRINPAEAKAST